MGYGQNLKDAINKKGWTVAKCAKEAHMKQQTLYTMIRRDRSIRYDFAIRLASVLGIEINELTKENPYDVEILDLFEHKDYPILHELITKFFILDDEGRRQIIDSENLVAMRHTDENRKLQLTEANKNNSKIRK